MTTQTTATVPPVQLTPQPESGRMLGSNGRYEKFLPDLIKERAPEGLIAHGPIVMFVDERATRRFARSLPGSRGPRPHTGARAE